ncbi:hypothetical protein G7007_16065 [Pseudomonas entomophila]|uniref:hypothetical protein n=1 Tax=Pseudomonas entomophila TaxID=312306 RepID=UPI0015E3184B|nr:hypothetical protein [Pseudomonas entomophila]MBA1194353.1 hypothetical protein [Pseudomonas entomophila]
MRDFIEYQRGQAASRGGMALGPGAAAQGSFARRCTERSLNGAQGRCGRRLGMISPVGLRILAALFKPG